MLTPSRFLHCDFFSALAVLPESLAICILGQAFDVESVVERRIMSLQDPTSSLTYGASRHPSGAPSNSAETRFCFICQEACTNLRPACLTRCVPSVRCPIGRCSRLRPSSYRNRAISTPRTSVTLFIQHQFEALP